MSKRRKERPRLLATKSVGCSRASHRFSCRMNSEARLLLTRYRDPYASVSMPSGKCRAPCVVVSQ